MTGIYGIRNLLNDKWYVGQSINIELRWKRHVWALNNEYHHNQHLLRSWKKYGESAFQFIALEECDAGDLNNREAYWINRLHSLENGYNECSGGAGTVGYKWSDEAKVKFAKGRIGEKNPFHGKHHSEEWRTRLSNRQTGKNNPMFGRTGKNHPRSRPVKCLETGIVYDGASEAQRQTGVNRNNICSCCTGKLKSAGKLHWEYAN